MTKFLLAIFLITILITVYVLASALTISVTGEEHQKPHGKKLYLRTIPLALLVFVFGYLYDVERDKDDAAKEKNAIYYEVTKETKEEIVKYCEKENVKYSRQENCKRYAIEALKYGESYEIFEPSEIVIKPSGVTPNN